jgi:Helix-turn-helix domain
MTHDTLRRPRLPPLLDATGAAELLAVPPSWVLAQARKDRIPHVRLGRYVRFDPNELVAWRRSRAGPSGRAFASVHARPHGAVSRYPEKPLWQLGLDWLAETIAGSTHWADRDRARALS